MSNVINYADTFSKDLDQQYAREASTNDFEDNKRYKIIDAQTIKVPTIELSGYKDHARDGSVNTGSVKNEWTPYMLDFDRDVQFYIDEADVIESNRVLEAANVTATFNTEQAIPETDAYRYSKLFADYTALGKTPTTTALDVNNILSIFDTMMSEMDEAGVPREGRKMKVTPTVDKLLKNAKEIQRFINVQGGGTVVNRIVTDLDGVEIKVVQASRMKTAFDFTVGFVPAVTAKQINFILYHNSAIIARKAIADIYLFPKGSEAAAAFGDLYKNRTYQGCWILKNKVDGIKFHTAA
jgi:hypothetical protein